LRITLLAAVAVPLGLSVGTSLLRAHDDDKDPKHVHATTKVADAATAPATRAVDPNAVVLTVGDEKLTAADFDALIADLPPNVQEMAKGPGKRMIADQLVQMKLLSAEARKRGLASSSKVKRQIAMVQEQVLASALVNDTDSMKKHLEAHKGEYEQVKARHILIRMAGSPVPNPEGAKELTDEQAKAKADDLRKKLAAGEDFAKLAQANSDDKGSGARGGDLGAFGRGEMVKPFADAAFAMKPGEVSDPVKTQFGYHIIQLQEKVPVDIEKLSEEQRGKLSQDVAKELLKTLKDAVKPKLDDGFFGPERPVMPPGFGE